MTNEDESGPAKLLEELPPARHYFEHIGEVLEVGQAAANHYLAHGYQLLLIAQRRELAERRFGMRDASRNEAGKGEQPGEFYIRQRPRYIVGRPRDVEPAPPVPGGGGARSYARAGDEHRGTERAVVPGRES